MKSAREWFAESDTHFGEGRCSMTQTTIEAIQLDAFKSGLKRAAKIVKNLKDDDVCEPVENILFAASKIVTVKEIHVVKG